MQDILREIMLISLVTTSLSFSPMANGTERVPIEDRMNTVVCEIFRATSKTLWAIQGPSLLNTNFKKKFEVSRQEAAAAIGKFRELNEAERLDLIAARWPWCRGSNGGFSRSFLPPGELHVWRLYRLAKTSRELLLGLKNRSTSEFSSIATNLYRDSHSLVGRMERWYEKDGNPNWVAIKGPLASYYSQVILQVGLKRAANGEHYMPSTRSHFWPLQRDYDDMVSDIQGGHALQSPRKLRAGVQDQIKQFTDDWVSLSRKWLGFVEKVGAGEIDSWYRQLNYRGSYVELMDSVFAHSRISLTSMSREFENDAAALESYLSN